MKAVVLGINAVSGRSPASEYLLLSKPGIVSMVLMSVLTGLCIGSRGRPDVALSFWTMFGVGLATAGCAFLNNYFDRDIDRMMKRTQARASAIEAVSPRNILISGVMLTTAGIITTQVFVNGLSSVLIAAAAVGYVGLYTVLLKRRTSVANQVGGMAGALPPVIGYVAVTHNLDMQALILFLIIVIWQQPHALSIALKYRDEYAAACIPVIPVAKGIQSTKRRIAVYAALLFLISIVPYLFGMAGRMYLAVSVLMGISFLSIAIRFIMSRRSSGMVLFYYSMIYLTILFAVLILDMV